MPAGKLVAQANALYAQANAFRIWGLDYVLGFPYWGTQPHNSPRPNAYLAPMQHSTLSLTAKVAKRLWTDDAKTNKHL